MPFGTVTVYHSDKGGGFARPDNAPEGDVFIHRTEVFRAGYLYLAEGQRVEYDTTQNPRRVNRTMAVGLRLLEPIMSPRRVSIELQPEDVFRYRFHAAGSMTEHRPSHEWCGLCRKLKLQRQRKSKSPLPTSDEQAAKGEASRVRPDRPTSSVAHC